MVRDFKKLKPITGQKLTEGLPLRINMTKPRLSMKLLWKLHRKFIAQWVEKSVGKDKKGIWAGASTDFLDFVESSMKPPSPLIR